MPVATTSRRRAIRRQASSDIEQEQPTQQRGHDDVEEDDVAPPKKSLKRVPKKEKVSAAPRADSKESDAAPGRGREDLDSDDEVIDVNNFQDQPLRKADMSKLQGLSEDWSHLGKTIRQTSAGVNQVAAAIAETIEMEESDKDLKEVELIMRELIDIGVEMDLHSAVLDEIRQHIAQGEGVVDVERKYEQGVEKKMEDYSQKTSRQKYAKSDDYAAFKSSIYEVLHQDEAMPPITEFLPKEDGDASDSDDELEVGGVTQDYKCPLSLTPLVNPVTSTVCGHSFSAESIKGFFARSSGPKTCPASGCNKAFKISDCKPNSNLAKKVKAWKRRTERAEMDSDADEVIE